jgi:hypothetical protein
MVLELHGFVKTTLTDIWSAAGIMLGVVVAVVSVSARTGRAAAARFVRRRERIADKISNSQEHDGVLRNLSTLSPEDQETFVELLKSGAPRFVVHRLSTAYPLLSKGILRSVQILDDLDWICEFHPAIVINRTKLLPLADAALLKRKA